MQRPHFSRSPALTQSQPNRSATYPPTARPSARVEADHRTLHIMHSTRPFTMSATNRPTKSPADPLFEHDLDRHPEDHFLSPVQMYEYEDWADDSSDDGDDGDFAEWDAGITDFALFQDERQRAEERNEDVPDRWQGFVASQASALQRAMKRKRGVSTDARGHAWIPPHNDLPQLTPDNSPDLRGQSDLDAYYGQRMPKSSFPSLKFTPPVDDHEDDDDEAVDDDSYDDDDEDDDEDFDEDDLPVAYLVARARERRQQMRVMEKPGMRFTRTLSGKVHVWRRPSMQIYDVDEEVETEGRAPDIDTTKRPLVKTRWSHW